MSKIGKTLFALLAVCMIAFALVASQPSASASPRVSGAYGTCSRPVTGNNVLVDCQYKGLYANQFLLANAYYWHPSGSDPTSMFQLSRRTFVRVTTVVDTGCVVLGIAHRSQTALTAPRMPCAGLGRVETAKEQHSVFQMYSTFCAWVAAKPPLFQIPAAERTFCAS